MARRSTSAKLEKLRETIAAAERRAAEREGELSGAKRRARSTDLELGDYFESVEAGEREADPAVESELVERQREARRESELAVERAEGTLRGAKRALTEAKNAEQRFIGEHPAELSAELTVRSELARDRLLETVEDFRSAVGEWQRSRSEWAGMLARWGISPAELPPVPFTAACQEIGKDLAPQAAGSERDPRRLVPMPRTMVPGEWSQFDGET